MAQEKLSLRNGEFWSFNLASFASNLSYFYLCGSGSVFWIEVHIVAEYGSNLDLDQQHWSKVPMTNWRTLNKKVHLVHVPYKRQYKNFPEQEKDT